MNFDNRGNLLENYVVNFEEFYSEFVSKWDSEDSIRSDISQIFQTYINDFKALITSEFIIWIDGSFLSNLKKDPQDIDFVIFINYEIIESKINLINNRFGKHGVKEFYGKQLDAYISPIYPTNHKNSFWTQSDKAYWIQQFSTTKPNRNGVKYSKGFIKMEFKNDERI